MKKILGFLMSLVMIFTTFTTTQAASWPAVSNNKYIKCYTITTANNTPVYTYSNFTSRKGTIYGSDELYVLEMNDTYCYVSYPTRSGRKKGYIKTSIITNNNVNHETNTARAKINVYKRANSGYYGYIAKNDQVIKVATSGNYTQVIYNITNGWKMGWISTDEYNKYLKTQTTNTVNIENGIYTIHTKMNHDYVWDISGASKENKANLQVYRSNGTKAQQFKLEKLNDGYYKITNVGSGKVIDCDNAGTALLTNLQQYSWNESNAQRFKIIDAGNGYVSFECKCNGLYVDVDKAGAYNGNNIQMYRNNGDNAQKFKLVKVNTIQATTYTNYYVNANSGLRLRAKPTTNSNTVLTMPNNACFKVAKVENGWAYGHYNNTFGYASTTYLRKENNTPIINNVITYTKYYVNANSGLRLRSKASTSSSTITTMPFGSVFEVQSMDNGWAYGKYQGKYGYASTTYLSKNNPMQVIVKPIIQINTTTQFDWPMDNPYCTWDGFTNYSWANKASDGVGEDYHLGIDIAGSNSNIYAAANGVVVATGRNGTGKKGNGNYVLIEHDLNGKKVYSFYAHLSSYEVSKDQVVYKGEKIGVMGNTGRSYGAHLHFAITTTKKTNGGYKGYSTKYSGSSRTYGGATFYDPVYVINNDRLP